MGQAFHESSKFEAKHMPDIQEFLASFRGAEVSLVTDRDQQMRFGDLTWVENGIRKFVDVKCDGTYHNNIFFEEYSNRTTGRKGWLRTLESNIIIYVHVNAKILVFIDLRKVRELIDSSSKSLLENSWKLRLQGKSVQENDTYGRAIPVIDLVRNNEKHKTLWGVYDYSDKDKIREIHLNKYPEELKQALEKGKNVRF